MSSPSKGKVAIVTGGAEGIGWATAQRLAQEVEHVVVADLRADAAQARAAALGERHCGLGADVTGQEDVAALVDTVMDRFGRIDMLVNNAGVPEQVAATVDQQLAAFDRVIGVHLRGTFLMSQAVGRVMLAQGCGSIVNLSSIAGFAGIPQRNAYAAAKAGIVIAGLSTVFGFAMIWHMWPLAAASFAATVLASIIHTFNYQRDYHIPAAEVAATEAARTQQLAAAHV